MHEISIRPWQSTDSAAELTELLHRAYARLADMGLRFWATHQSAEVTEKRIAEGECFVAVADGVICGTIVFRAAADTKGSPWYDRPDVASFAQFAVEPGLRTVLRAHDPSSVRPHDLIDTRNRKERAQAS